MMFCTFIRSETASILHLYTVLHTQVSPKIGADSVMIVTLMGIVTLTLVLIKIEMGVSRSLHLSPTRNHPHWLPVHQQITGIVPSPPSMPMSNVTAAQATRLESQSPIVDGHQVIIFSCHLFYPAAVSEF